MFTLPKLNYSYDALEPFIDAKTMEIHQTKHHLGYINKLNTAIEGLDIDSDNKLIIYLQDTSKLPDTVRASIINNGGGYLNHKLFWMTMSPTPSNSPSNDLLTAINTTFGSFDKFQTVFTDKATTHFGSGWAWLVLKDKKLEVLTTSNQDSPYMTGHTPILGIDLWEHAYYLNYQNRRPEYIENWWKVVDWKTVGYIYNQLY